LNIIPTPPTPRIETRAQRHTRELAERQRAALVEVLRESGFRTLSGAVAVCSPEIVDEFFRVDPAFVFSKVQRRLAR